MTRSSKQEQAGPERSLRPRSSTNPRPALMRRKWSDLYDDGPDPRNPAQNVDSRGDVGDAHARAMPFVEICGPGLSAKGVDPNVTVGVLRSWGAHTQEAVAASCVVPRVALRIVYAFAADVRQAARTTREGSTRVMSGACGGADSPVRLSNRYPTPGYVRMTPLAFGEESFRRRLATWARSVCLSSA
jgi:hypothetical protein